MGQLPVEILLHICSYADNDALSRLCIANHAMYDHVLPMLYKHVRLDGTEKIKQFNGTLASTPRYGHLMHSIVLVDSHSNASAESFRLEEEEHPDTLEVWSKLIRNMALLSRNHSLKTIALSREVCERIEYAGCRPALGDLLEESDFVLDELIICHSPLEFFLSRMDVKRVTWYTCSKAIEAGVEAIDGGIMDLSAQDHNYYLDHDLDSDSESENEERDNKRDAEEEERRQRFLNDFFPFRRLREIKYMIGDASEIVGGVLKNAAENEKEKKPAWTWDLSEQIDALKDSQPDLILCTVNLHVQTSRSRAALEAELDPGDETTIGSWGRASDVCQKDAERESFKCRDWQHSDTYSSTAGSERIAVLDPAIEHNVVNHDEDDKEVRWCSCYNVRQAENEMVVPKPAPSTYNASYGGIDSDDHDDWYNDDCGRDYYFETEYSWLTG